MKIKTIASLGLLLAFGAAAAQGVERKNEPYAPADLPFARPAATSSELADVPAVPAAQAAQFEVVAGDRSVREVLARWARSAGWAHEPMHWTIDRDHPIQGVAGPEVFGGEFKGAARKLLSSTELTDRPVQPCFYLNNVVRVIPRAELCDRTQP